MAHRPKEEAEITRPEDHLFIQELLRQYNLSVSQLAEKVGVADSTMYEYTGGRKKSIPLTIWRALFELTEDVRIVEMLVGDVEVFIVPMPRPHALDYTEDTLKRLIEKRKKDIECETAILDILADGKIDRDDWKAIEQYREAHPEALKLDAQIYRTILGKYEQSLRRAAES